MVLAVPEATAPVGAECRDCVFAVDVEDDEAAVEDVPPAERGAEDAPSMTAGNTGTGGAGGRLESSERGEIASSRCCISSLNVSLSNTDDCSTPDGVASAPAPAPTLAAPLLAALVSRSGGSSHGGNADAAGAGAGAGAAEAVVLPVPAPT